MSEQQKKEKFDKALNSTNVGNRLDAQKDPKSPAKAGAPQNLINQNSTPKSKSPEKIGKLSGPATGSSGRQPPLQPFGEPNTVNSRTSKPTGKPGGDGDHVLEEQKRNSGTGRLSQTSMTSPGASGVSSKGLTPGATSISQSQQQPNQSSSTANNQAASTAANNAQADPAANSQKPEDQDVRTRMKDYKEGIAEQRKEQKKLELMNVDSTKQLKLTRIVALIVLICYTIQLYHNMGWRSYLSDAQKTAIDAYGKGIGAADNMISAAGNTRDWFVDKVESLKKDDAPDCKDEKDRADAELARYKQALIDKDNEINAIEKSKPVKELEPDNTWLLQKTDVSVMQGHLKVIHDSFTQDLTNEQSKVLNVKDYWKRNVDWRSKNEEFVSQIVYMNQGLKKGQLPPNSDTYNGKSYGKDILLKKVLSKPQVQLVNTVVDLLENQSMRSDLPTTEKAARFNKKCSVKEYFDKLSSGTKSARNFVHQLFAGEDQGPNACNATKATGSYW